MANVDTNVTHPPHPTDAQASLWDSNREDTSPAAEWDKDSVRRSLDELFSLARQYRSSKDYQELIRFVARFRWYAPFNAMLVHIQMPGATFVAPPHRWLSEYGRRVTAGARPLVILQPMGPVMFVFDVADTEPDPKCEESSLPREVEHPFEVRRGKIRGELTQTIENAKRDGVAVAECQAGSQSAGLIRVAEGKKLKVLVKLRPKAEFEWVLQRFELLLNEDHSTETMYATLVHELGHLYCGHLGTPDDTWWPDRRGLPDDVCEFEAESICYLVCSRLRVENPSDVYLSRYLGNQEEIPPISLDCLMKAAGLIEQMGRERLKPRKKTEH